MNSSIKVASKYLTRISVTIASTFTPKTKPNNGCSCFLSCSICVGILNVSSVIVYRRSNVHHLILRWPSPTTTTHLLSMHPPMEITRVHTLDNVISHKCQAFVHPRFIIVDKRVKRSLLPCHTKGEWYVDDKMLLSLHIKTVSTAAFQSSSNEKRPWCWSSFLRTEHEHWQAEKASFCTTALSTTGWFFDLKLTPK